MIILGLNAFHADSSAALVRDGKLIAAAEEERFRRIKHWAGFPSQAIAYCLNEAGIKLSDVEHIAFNQDSRANLLRKITYFLTKRPNINLVLRRLRNRRSRAGILPGAKLTGKESNAPLPAATAHARWMPVFRLARRMRRRRSRVPSLATNLGYLVHDKTQHDYHQYHAADYGAPAPCSPG